MFSIASAEKITLSCGTMPMRERSASSATRSTALAVDAGPRPTRRRRSAGRSWNTVLLPAPLGPTRATVSPGATSRLKRDQRRMLRPRRVAEGDVLAGAPPSRRWRAGSGSGAGGERTGELQGEQLHQALGRAGGAQQVAVDLGQHGDAADQDDHVDHRLAEVAGA